MRFASRMIRQILLVVMMLIAYPAAASDFIGALTIFFGFPVLTIYCFILGVVLSHHLVLVGRMGFRAWSMSFGLVGFIIGIPSILYLISVIKMFSRGDVNYFYYAIYLLSSLSLLLVVIFISFLLSTKYKVTIGKITSWVAIILTVLVSILLIVDLNEAMKNNPDDWLIAVVPFFLFVMNLWLHSRVCRLNNISTG